VRTHRSLLFFVHILAFVPRRRGAIGRAWALGGSRHRLALGPAVRPAVGPAPCANGSRQQTTLGGYLNKEIEQDHRRIKQRVRPMLGFKRFETAAVTIRGVELAEKSKNISSASNQKPEKRPPLRKCGPGSWQPELWKIIHPRKTYT
jgi:hypothetical protein